MSCRSIEDHSAGWSYLWDSGESGLWDRGKASPALVDIIEKERDLFNPFTSDGQRKKALVPVSHPFLPQSVIALDGPPADPEAIGLWPRL